MPIHNIHKIKQQVLHSVYVRTATPSRPASALYIATANDLKTAMYKGFGGDMVSFVYDSPDLNMLTELRDNIYMFSGAKTFQHTLQMSEELLDESGKLRSFKDFENIAGKIFDTYNEDWLKTEYNTAMGMARSASKWVDIEKNKETFPLLRYVAVGDEHTCDICRPLDGIVLPVNDPFWSKNMPLNHFNCECTVEQLEADEASPTDKYDADSRETESQDKKNKLFNMNPGKSKEIFRSTGKNKHPYFEIPAKYKELAKQNFQLTIPYKD